MEKEQVKHTPGKWEYGVRSDGSIWISLGDPANGQHYQGDLIASEDDARLIAAAPDLLKALRMFVAYDDSAFEDHIDLMIKYADVIDAARAAIAKATGSKA